jgi:hypothetical protein
VGRRKRSVRRYWDAQIIGFEGVMIKKKLRQKYGKIGIL